MKNTKHSANGNFADTIASSPMATLIIAVLAICMGIFFIFSQGDNKPIERKDAVSYSGEFEKYETSRNYHTICFEDGSQYSVYPHTDTNEFISAMQSLDKGTRLYILVNPNNGFVAEVKTDTEELLNFELSQQKIDDYDNSYVVIGCIACISGVFLIIYAVGSSRYKRKEKARHAKGKKRI